MWRTIVAATACVRGATMEIVVVLLVVLQVRCRRVLGLAAVVHGLLVGSYAAVLVVRHVSSSTAAVVIVVDVMRRRLVESGTTTVARIEGARNGVVAHGVRPTAVVLLLLLGHGYVYPWKALELDLALRWPNYARSGQDLGQDGGPNGGRRDECGCRGVEGWRPR